MPKSPANRAYDSGADASILPAATPGV